MNLMFVKPTKTLVQVVHLQMSKARYNTRINNVDVYLRFECKCTSGFRIANTGKAAVRKIVSQVTNFVPK